MSDVLDVIKFILWSKEQGRQRQIEGTSNIADVIKEFGEQEARRTFGPEGMEKFARPRGITYPQTQEVRTVPGASGLPDAQYDTPSVELSGMLTDPARTKTPGVFQSPVYQGPNFQQAMNIGLRDVAQKYGPEQIAKWKLGLEATPQEQRALNQNVVNVATHFMSQGLQVQEPDGKTRPITMNEASSMARSAIEQGIDPETAKGLPFPGVIQKPQNQELWQQRAEAVDKIQHLEGRDFRSLSTDERGLVNRARALQGADIAGGKVSLIGMNRPHFVLIPQFDRKTNSMYSSWADPTTGTIVGEVPNSRRPITGETTTRDVASIAGRIIDDSHREAVQRVSAQGFGDLVQTPDGRVTLRFKNPVEGQRLYQQSFDESFNKYADYYRKSFGINIPNMGNVTQQPTPTNGEVAVSHTQGQTKTVRFVDDGTGKTYDLPPEKVKDFIKSHPQARRVR